MNRTTSKFFHAGHIDARVAAAAARDRHEGSLKDANCLLYAMGL